jgi:hypothetical protein
MLPRPHPNRGEFVKVLDKRSAFTLIDLIVSRSAWLEHETSTTGAVERGPATSPKPPHTTVASSPNQSHGILDN